jgi:hypothetical protein
VANTVPKGFDPDATVARFFGVHVKSLKRWDERPELGFPRPVKILGRNYRSRAEYREFARRAAAAFAAKA